PPVRRSVAYPAAVALPSLRLLLPPTAPSQTHPLSLHDALPISRPAWPAAPPPGYTGFSSPSPPQSRYSWYKRSSPCWTAAARRSDRKSTRLNSSHVSISYAVFCLKKKKQQPHR